MAKWLKKGCPILGSLFISSPSPNLKHFHAIHGIGKVLFYSGALSVGNKNLSLIIFSDIVKQLKTALRVEFIENIIEQ